VHSLLRYQNAVVLAGVSLLGSPAPVKAQKIVGNGEIAGAIVGIAAAGVVIGVGTYYLLRKASITGCAVSECRPGQLRRRRVWWFASFWSLTFTVVGDLLDPMYRHRDMGTPT
jgi:hypothetical protein